MMLRTCQVIFLWLIVNSINAQYIDGIATDSIDQLHLDVRNEFAAMNFSESIKTSEQFMNYWLGRKNEVPTDKDVMSNYLYSFIEHYKSKRRVNQLNKMIAQDYFNIKPEIIKRLGDSHLLLANYYTFAGEIYHTIVGDRQAAVEACEAAVKIRRKLAPEKIKAIANDLISLGYSYNRLNMMDSSLHHLEEALVLTKQVVPKATLMIMRNMYAIAMTYNSNREYDKALKIFVEAYEFGIEDTPPDHDVNVVLTQNISHLSETVGDMDLALDFAFKGLQLSKIRPDNLKDRKHTFYEAIARISILRGELLTANTYLDSSFLIMNKNDIKIGLSSLMLQKAALAPNVEEELYYKEESYKYCEQEPDCRGNKYHLMLTSVARVHEKKGDYQSALNLALKSKILQEADNRRNDEVLPETYSLLSRLYNTSGQSDQALDYAKLAVQAQENISEKTGYKTAIYESQLAKHYLKEGEAELAENIYKNSLTTLRNNIGDESLLTINVINSLSELYYEGEKYDSSLFYAELTQQELSKNYDLTHDHFLTPLLYSAKGHLKMNNKDTAQIFLNKVMANCGFSKFDSDKVNDYDISDYRLWKSFESFLEVLQIEEELHEDGNIEFLKGKVKTGLSLIDKLRTLYFFEVSEKDFQQRIRSFVNWSISKLSDRSTTDEEVLQLIFECMEKSRSILINRNFVRTKSLQDQDLPKHVLDEEKSILMEYQYYFEKYEMASSESNDSMRNVYVNLMFDLETKKQTLLENIKLDYPKYYNERYSQDIIDLQTLQEFVAEEELGTLVYHWGEDNLYSLLVSPSGTYFKIISISDVAQTINELKRLIQHKVVAESGFETALQDFAFQASTLYDRLLSNWSDTELPFRLVIVPDGGLVNLPFDILITESKSQVVSYKQLSYLFRTHAVNYIGSTSQLFNTRIPNDKEKRYIGFAPDYTLQLKTDDINDGFTSRNKELSPLKFNAQEIENTADLFGGDKFIGSSASVAKFRDLASSSDYLHLAMHAVVNDDFPLESYISFGPSDSIGVEAKLEVREISQMQLDNQLVILSACETNVGSNVLGEGILGIARAFNLASCPNLIMSSWVVDDKSSSQILYSFFRNLLDNNDVADSLRKAKLNYLDQSSQLNAHPSYWAAFSYYGSPVQNPSRLFRISSILSLLGLSFLGLLVILLGMKFRSKGQAA